MSKRKSEARCPHCGGIGFIETIQQTLETGITTDNGLCRAYKEVKACSQQFCYKCTTCDALYYENNAEQFYENLKKACAVLGKVRYVVNYDKLLVEKTTVKSVSHYLSEAFTDFNPYEAVPLEKLYKTCKEGKKALLEYLQEKWIEASVARDSKWKECQEYEKRIKELKRSIR